MLNSVLLRPLRHHWLCFNRAFLIDWQMKLRLQLLFDFLAQGSGQKLTRLLALVSGKAFGLDGCVALG